MHLNNYYHEIFVPSNVAISALRRAGLPVSVARIQATRTEWTTKLKDLEQYVEGEAAKRGMRLKYSAAHATSPQPLRDFLYSAQGLGLEVKRRTDPSKTYPEGQASTDENALMDYASVANPREGDHPVVTAILKIRSLAKGISTYLDAFERSVRADGCVHPHFKWNLRTPRLAAEDPPVHQIPEKGGDKEVAKGVKCCLVPRVNPAPDPEVWDPRKHGSCIRWDIKGAEAVIRAAMLTARLCTQPDPVAYDYLRFGKDIHSKTASLIFNKPEGTYKKNTYERDVAGKQTFFAKLYGGGAYTVKQTIYERARIKLSDKEAERISDAFDEGYPGLVELYELDKQHLGEHGYCEDGYGRRRWVGLPERCRYMGMNQGRTVWEVDGLRATCKEEIDKGRKWLFKKLEHCWSVATNTPTQGMSATDTLWMIALLYHGEYTPLAVPALWSERGVLYPEAATWCLHEGRGPGGKPMRAWHGNTVHDSAWLDCAPGYVEPVVKLVARRCTAVPFDWRLEADVPYRVEVQVGPDYAHLYDYNDVAKRFGLEPLPEL